MKKAYTAFHDQHQGTDSKETMHDSHVTDFKYSHTSFYSASYSDNTYRKVYSQPVAKKKLICDATGTGLNQQHYPIVAIADGYGHVEEAQQISKLVVEKAIAYCQLNIYSSSKEFLEKTELISFLNKTVDENKLNSEACSLVVSQVFPSSFKDKVDIATICIGDSGAILLEPDQEGWKIYEIATPKQDGRTGPFGGMGNKSYGITEHHIFKSVETVHKDSIVIQYTDGLFDVFETSEVESNKCYEVKWTENAKSQLQKILYGCKNSIEINAKLVNYINWVLEEKRKKIADIIFTQQTPNYKDYAKQLGAYFNEYVKHTSTKLTVSGFLQYLQQNDNQHKKNAFFILQQCRYDQVKNDSIKNTEQFKTEILSSIANLAYGDDTTIHCVDMSPEQSVDNLLTNDALFKLTLKNSCFFLFLYSLDDAFSAEKLREKLKNTVKIILDEVCIDWKNNEKKVYFNTFIDYYQPVSHHPLFKQVIKFNDEIQKLTFPKDLEKIQKLQETREHLIAYINKIVLNQELRTEEIKKTFENKATRHTLNQSGFFENFVNILAPNTFETENLKLLNETSEKLQQLTIKK